MWVPGILVLIIVGIVLLRKFNIAMPKFTLPGNLSSDIKGGWKVIGGVTAVIALGLVIMFVDNWLFWGALILFCMGIWFEQKRAQPLNAGPFTKIAGSAVVIILFSQVLFGNKAGEVGTAIRDVATSTVLGTATSSTVRPRLQNLLVEFNEDALRNKIWVLTDAKWERPRDEDGALPTGVRSGTVHLPVGCNIQFPNGWGHAFTVWASNTNPGNGAPISDWTSYSITAVNIVANEYAIELKAPNVKRFNYLITCPKGTWVPKENDSGNQKPKVRNIRFSAD